MIEAWFARLLAPWLVVFAAPPVEPPASPDGLSLGSEHEIARLAGQRVRILGREPASDPTRDSDADARILYMIEDIAAEGKPWIGHVRARGERLVLELRDGTALPLAGPLARKRMAGPGYKVWIIGDISGRPAVLHARRLGVLAPPSPSLESSGRERSPPG